ncbi:MAG: transglutaminase domain-containing protein, partial [Alphaproteobacteria bacterium]|nr:transglutaminase domain-containing protein [Alphaproteobacteria bacterium]
GIKAFADMLERVKEIPSQLTQIETINAWVNLYIRYDKKEAKDDLPHRSLERALIDRKGVCDEIARLKLFALEALGYQENDIRWVSETYYKNDVRNDPGHAVTLVRIGDDHWILNDWSSSIRKYRITEKNAADMMDGASQIEKASTELNITGESFWGEQGHALMPEASFNSNERAVYDVTAHNKLPETAMSEASREAEYSDTRLSDTPDVWRDVVPILQSAVMAHHEVTRNGRRVENITFFNRPEKHQGVWGLVRSLIPG